MCWFILLKDCARIFEGHVESRFDAPTQTVIGKQKLLNLP